MAAPADSSDFAIPVSRARLPRPEVLVANLWKSYGRTEAVRGIGFRVQKGEIFGLLGSNGAGKSTTIKIIAGLMQPSTGKVFINGVGVHKEPIRAKSRLGYLPELPILYEHLTGREFLVMIGQLRGLDSTSIKRAIVEGTTRLELWDSLDMQIGQYSKGTKQKTAFLMAIMGIPQVLLLDEPSSGLDPRLNRIIKEWLLELKRNYGVTIILSTHMTDMAESLCDRVAIIDRGTIIAKGSVGEILELAGARDLEEAFVILIESGKTQ